jgi:hypothetical protein
MKVIGQRLEYFPSYSVSTMATTGGGTNNSQTHSLAHAVGSQWSHTDTEAAALTRSSAATVTASVTDGTERSNSLGETKSSVESGGVSNAASHSHGVTANASINESTGISGRDILPKTADGNRTVDFQTHVDGGGMDETWNRTITGGTGLSDATAITETNSTGWNKAKSQNAGLSLGKSHAIGSSTGRSDGTAVTATTSVADTVGGTESITTTDAQTVGESTNWSDAKGQGVTWAPVMVSIFSLEAEQPVFYTPEEQRLLAKQDIARLDKREAYILTGGEDIPVLIRSPEVTRPDLCRVVIDMAAGWFQRISGFTLSLATAIKEMRERDQEWIGGGVLAAADADFAPSGNVITPVKVKRVGRA